MTAKQTDFIRTLVDERREQLEQISGSEPGSDQRRASWVLDFTAGRTGQHPTVQQASSIISWLLSLPRTTHEGAATEQGEPIDVPAGRYAIVAEDGTIKFYRVDRPTEGKWAGWTFVKVQASDEEYPVRDRKARAAILAEIAEDVEGALRRYGHELGRCGHCGRTLTDETSRAMGIGPDCARKLGLDRSPYAERARREAVERVTGGEEASPVPAAGEEERHDDQAGTTEPRSDPQASMGWREAREAVREQQDEAGPAKRDYPGMRRAAAGVVEGMAAPFTVHVDGGAPLTIQDGAEAYMTGLRKWQETTGWARVMVTDARGELVADFDF